MSYYTEEEAKDLLTPAPQQEQDEPQINRLNRVQNPFKPRTARYLLQGGANPPNQQVCFNNNNQRQNQQYGYNNPQNTGQPYWQMMRKW